MDCTDCIHFDPINPIIVLANLYVSAQAFGFSNKYFLAQLFFSLGLLGLFSKILHSENPIDDQAPLI